MVVLMGASSSIQAGEVLNHARWLKVWRSERAASGKKENLLDQILYQAVIYSELIDESVDLQIKAAKRCDWEAYRKADLEKSLFISGLESLLLHAEAGFEIAMESHTTFWDKFFAIDDPIGQVKEAFRIEAIPATERATKTTTETWIKDNQFRAYYNPAAGGFEYRKGFYPANEKEETELSANRVGIARQGLEAIRLLRREIQPRLDQERLNNFWDKCPPRDPAELDFHKLNLNLTDFWEEFNPLVSLRDVLEASWEKMSPEERAALEEIEKMLEANTGRKMPPPKRGSRKNADIEEGQTFDEWAEETSRALGFTDDADAGKKEAADPKPPQKKADDGFSDGQIDTELIVKIFATMPDHIRDELIARRRMVAFQRQLTGYLDQLLYDRYLIRLKEIMTDRQIPVKNSAINEHNHDILPLDPNADLMSAVLSSLVALDVMPPGIDPVFLSTIRNDYNNLRQGIYSFAMFQRPMTETERKTAEYYLTEPFSVDPVNERALWLKGPCAELGGYHPPTAAVGDISRIVNTKAPGPAENQAYAERVKAEQGYLFEKYRRWAASMRIRRSLDPVSKNSPSPQAPSRAAPTLEAPRPALEGLGVPPPGTLTRPKL